LGNSWDIALKDGAGEDGSAVELQARRILSGVDGSVKFEWSQLDGKITVSFKCCVVKISPETFMQSAPVVEAIENRYRESKGDEACNRVEASRGEVRHTTLGDSVDGSTSALFEYQASGFTRK
jgi:hypothetical protein